MNEQNKKTLKQWLGWVLIALAVILVIAASSGSALYGKEQSDAIYIIAGAANLVGWGYIAYRAFNKTKPKE